MKVLTLNLKEFVQILNNPAEKRYAVAVIDNAPPSRPQLPLIGKNFIWIKGGYIPTRRKELEKLFLTYGIKVKGWIAVFHHHDLPKPYLRFEKEEIECYEFSHEVGLAYEAFKHADAKLLSHILSGTFRKYDKVRLVKAEIPHSELVKIQKKFWFLDIHPKEGKEGVELEDFLLYCLALKMSPGRIVPDPKRYRPETHNGLIKAGLPVDQYAIPAMWREVEIQTGTKLDKEIAKIMLEKKMDWQKEIERLKKEKEAELARIAQEKKLRERGELVPGDAKNYIDSIAPSLGCDFTYDPVYPPKRKDIAIIRRLVENGQSYGFDIIYLVWRAKDGIRAKELIDSRTTKDYIHIKSVSETQSGIVVEVRSGGTYSGIPWEKRIEIDFAEFNQLGEEKPSRLAGGLTAKSHYLGSFSPEAERFLKAMAEQMARCGLAFAGQKSKGEEKLELQYHDLLKKLIQKHPHLQESFRLAVIAEVYDEKLVASTFSLLEATDEKCANQILHILGEMAMLRNNPSLYLRVVNLLKKNLKDEKRLKEILSDSRFEFQIDEVIEKALREYE